MAFSSVGILSLLIAILSGGATDSLDFVSTEAYWKTKDVTVSVEQLLGELKTADAADITADVRALGGGTFAEREAASKRILARGPAVLPQLEKFRDDADAEVASRVTTLIPRIRAASKGQSLRRLMAIRTLGEMRKAEALPVLRDLLSSKEMFVADYAARAIAQVEGKPLPTRGPAPDALKSDVALFPANCGVVGQVSFVNRRAISLEELVKNIPGGPAGDAEVAKSVETLTPLLLGTLESIGNVRIESVTFAAADHIADDDGFFALVVRGRYDRDAVAALLRRIFPQAATVDGVEVISPNKQLAFALPNDELLVACVGPGQDKLPIRELIGAIRGGRGALLDNPEMARLVASADPTARAWAAARGTKYPKAEIVNTFDHIILVGKEAGDALNLKVTGTGSDAATVTAAVDKLNQYIETARQQVPQAVGQMPFLKPVQELLQSIKCEADGKTAALTGVYRGDPAALIAIPAVGLGVRAAPREAPPAQAQPARGAQPEPVR